MSPFSLQTTSEYAAPHLATLQSGDSAFPRLRETDMPANLPHGSHSETQSGSAGRPTRHLDHNGGYASVYNKANLCILRAAKNYNERLSFLREEGKLDGVSLNPDSIGGFMKFIAEYMPTVRGGLVLVDNGNLRAVWHSDSESFVGIQFLNLELTEYVLFSQISLSSSVSRSFGQASIDVVMNQIEALELNSMLYEQS